MRIRIILLVLLLTVWTLTIMATSLQPQIKAPDSVLHDEPFAVIVEGLTPGTTYTLQTELYSGSGTIWRSEGQFQADSTGTFNVARDVPVSGPWANVDALGPFWTLQNTKEKSWCRCKILDRFTNKRGTGAASRTNSTAFSRKLARKNSLIIS